MDIYPLLQIDEKHVMVRVNREILDRLYKYLASRDDTETTVSAVITNWIDTQIVEDMQEAGSGVRHG
jgi:hypothetical protein